MSIEALARRIIVPTRGWFRPPSTVDMIPLPNQSTKLYVKDVARDSDDLIAFYQDMRDNAEDGDIRAYATEMLPEVTAHRRYAHDMLAANDAH